MPGPILFTPFAASCLVAPTGCLIGNVLLAGGTVVYEWHRHSSRRDKPQLPQKGANKKTFQVPWGRRRQPPEPSRGEEEPHV
ncbi:unnamed protein product, partial [Pylaiella littoralis]